MFLKNLATIGIICSLAHTLYWSAKNFIPYQRDIVDSLKIRRLGDVEFGVEWADSFKILTTEPHHNFRTLESWYIVDTYDTSGGRVFTMYEHIEPQGFVNVKHVHPFQIEEIVVLKGKIKICLESQRNLYLEAGDSIIVPATIEHEINNREMEEETLMRVSYYPGVPNQELLFMRLANLSKTELDENGFPAYSNGILNLPLTARIFKDIRGLFWRKPLPGFIQEWVFSAMYYFGA